MSLADTLLNRVRLNSESDPRDDEYYDDEYYDEDEQPGRRVIHFRDDDDDFDDDDDDVRDRSEDRASARRSLRSVKAKTTAKVSQIRSRNAVDADGNLAVCVIRPHSMDDAQEVTDTLLDGCAVILNMEGIELDLAQRIIDFSSGACYAMAGNLQKITNYIFLITPSNVKISGDFQDLISGAFDVPFDHQSY